MVQKSENEIKSVLLIIGGGIAAYKSLELIRELQKNNILVRAVLTKSGEEFVTPLSVATLSGEKVFTDLFDLKDETEIGHIELSRQSDLIVVAPATADLLAKMAHGLATDLATTLLLATDKPVLVAPAMNVKMWQHPATERNINSLGQDGIRFVGPNEGEMACGEFGPGRMAEVDEILDAISKQSPGRDQSNSEQSLAGKHVLITAGPTHEPIDPVRYIANRSSGKQGYAIARAALDAGAKVSLISGPTELASPTGAHIVHVETAREMLDATLAHLPCDIAICTAAVADWHVENEGKQKIKKTSKGLPVLEFSENPDILQTLGSKTPMRPGLVIGFAAETENLLDHARAKLKAKGCDWIVANDVSFKKQLLGDPSIAKQTGVMGGDHNTIHLLTKEGVESWPEMSKVDVAEKLILTISDFVNNKKAAAE